MPDKCPLVIVPHRALAVIVAAGGLGKVLIVSSYFVTNPHAKAKATPENLRMLACIGDHIQAVGLPACIGADWQMEPQVLDSTDFPTSFGLRCFADK